MDHMILYGILFSIMFFAAIKLVKSGDNDMIDVLIRKGRNE